ncbi:unnamed protein product [Ectocarpus sp. CCAP 1310/34]|nr:unnamed protein product [Ectocarpus sp. CCAP 1310/34]
MWHDTSRQRFLRTKYVSIPLSQTGEICLNILKKEWSPAWSLQVAGSPKADAFKQSLELRRRQQEQQEQHQQQV